MASSAGLPPADARHADAAAPSDGFDALHSALAAAEAELLATRGASLTASTPLPANTRALLRRVGALSAELSAVHDTLAAQQPGASDAGPCGVSRQRQRVEFSSLPHSLVVRVLAALPADARLRCAEVCRTWRAAVLDRSLWLRVDLLPASGVTHAVTPALLRAVMARAAGHLQALRLPSLVTATFMGTLLELLRANSASFRELEATAPLEQAPYFMLEEHTQLADVEHMLRAAPQVEMIHVIVMAPVREAARMLRNEAPFGPLRVYCMHVTNPRRAMEDGAELVALAAAMRQHASLSAVWLQDAPLDAPNVLHAFIDAALEQRFQFLDLQRCSLTPASAPALARLLGSTALMRLTVENDGELLVGAAATVLAGALRANTTLRCLQLDAVGLWNDADADAAVLAALTAHPSLRELHLTNNRVHVNAAAAAGAALGTLIAANAPALRELYLSYSSLGDAGLAPLFRALPHNTHLRELRCHDNAMSDAFARNCLLPAIRANTSLRVLHASEWWGGEEDAVAPDEVLQAEALVTARADADAAAANAAA
jgi:hypothetical protein